jgi:O-antigen/teichoic acid export membrane protein
MLNMSWLGLGEVVARVTRLATTIVIARRLGPAELGIAAIALTSFEIIRAFAGSGIGQMVARATPEQLAATAATASRANWMLCFALAGIQILAGALLAAFTGRTELVLMVGCLAGVFLLMPLGLMQCYLVIRANRLATIARVSTVQLVADNALTAALAVAGLGAWAIVLPKLLTAPIWVIGMRRAATWSRDPSAIAIPFSEMTRFAAPILGTELLAALRMNLDKLLVTAILGVEILGVYYFAFNAGLGLSLSLTNALSASVYPALSALAGSPSEMLARFDRILWRNALPVSLVIAAQAAAALVYVPVVFGGHWADAAPLVALLCVSAITRPVWDAAAQLLRAAGLPGFEFAGALIYSVVYLAAFAAFLPFGLATGITALAFAALLLNVALAAWARSLVLRHAVAPSPTGQAGQAIGPVAAVAR